MTKAARELSVLFWPGQLSGVFEGFGETLAGHLLGRRLERGQRVALPGWPPLTVEDVQPAGGEVRPGTAVEVTVPPSPGQGPLNLAILVDASLTMGEGEDTTPYDRAAALTDAFLMNGRSFLGAVAIVVQGGETRHVEELSDPQSLSGAAIHRVQPRGTFDLEEGLERALDVLEPAAEGPRAVLVATDGAVDVPDPLATALPVVHAGARLFALAGDPGSALRAACEHGGGVADSDPETVFAALAERAGARADWTPPPDPDPVEEPRFEVVIETMEETL